MLARRELKRERERVEGEGRKGLRGQRPKSSALGQSQREPRPNSPRQILASATNTLQLICNLREKAFLRALLKVLVVSQKMYWLDRYIG